MDYEKKYRDLVEAVKELQEANPSDEGIQKWVEDNVPELAESEDERISREITEFLVAFNNGGYERPNENTIDSWLSWLEKQGEKGINGKNREIPFSEQKPAWSEEDEKYWSIVIAEFSKCAGKSVSKDEWMRCNDWLNSLKDRIQPQHKQEWSERDELMLGKCINAVSGYYSPEDKQSMKDWLYFLKQRHTWKPSDEQMKALWVTFMGGEEQAALASLYNDLKKLK